MAKLSRHYSKRVTKAREGVEYYGKKMRNEKDFLDDVDHLVRAVQDETELALMKGKVRFLGEPYMLYRALESVVGQERRPVHRAAAIQAICDALSKYLGLKFTPGMQKRKRKELLPHV